MPNGKPNPECKDCNGTGEVVLFTSSKICDCVNRQPVGTGATNQLYNTFDGFGDLEYYDKKFEMAPVPRIYMDPALLKELEKGE